MATDIAAEDHSAGAWKRVAAYSLAFSKSRLNADLSGTVLNALPDKWIGDDPKDFARIAWVDLSNRFLVGLSLKRAVLVKADFSGSDLGGADLRHASVSTSSVGPRSFIAADLRHATLSGGSWNQTLFYGARLEGADLSKVQDLNPQALAFVMIDKTTRLPESVVPLEPLSAPLSRYQAARLRLATTSCVLDEDGRRSLPSAVSSRAVQCLAAARESIYHDRNLSVLPPRAR